MVIQTLKENRSVNYKFYTTNSTLVQENLAKRWQEQVSIGQLGET